MSERMVVRFRAPEKLAPLLGPVSRAFPDADRVDVTTVSLDVILLNQGQPVGLLDVTLYVKDRVSVMFARRGQGNLPAVQNLPPEPVDPFAAGVPGAIRVWLEGMLLGRKAEPPVVLPFTPMVQVLDALPQAAHQRAEQIENTRRAEAGHMSAYVRERAFDRIVVRVREASASVSARGRVLGTLRFGVEAEEKELRINAFDPRRAK
jgi:hypothetical protein